MSNGQLTTEMTAPEKSDLRRCEKVIEKGLGTFIEVGRSLKEISENKLYRDKHLTFEAYVKSRWDMGKSRAYQLIDAVDLDEQIKKSTMVDKIELKNERQARELSDIPEDSLETVIDKAVELAGDETPNSTHIKKAKKEVLTPPATNGKTDLPKAKDSGTKPGGDSEKVRSAALKRLQERAVSVRRDMFHFDEFTEKDRSFMDGIVKKVESIE